MSSQRKLFRVELMDRPAGTPPAEEELTPARHQELVAEIKALRAMMEQRFPVSEQVLASYKEQIAEAQRLKSELDFVHGAIDRTKREMVALQLRNGDYAQLSRVSQQLDAIATGSETATEKILGAAEAIDEHAAKLGDLMAEAPYRALAHEIQDRVVTILEACNFQDITGQRISKVLDALQIVETRFARLMKIWDGIKGFDGGEMEPLPMRTREPDLLNGPKVEGDSGHATQDEIDALFNTPLAAE